MFSEQKIALELLEADASMSIPDVDLVVPFLMLSSAVAGDGAGYEDYDAVKHNKPMTLELMSAMVRNHRGEDFVFRHVCDVLIELFTTKRRDATDVSCEKSTTDQAQTEQRTAHTEAKPVFDWYALVIGLSIWLGKLLKVLSLAALALLVVYLFMVGMRFAGALFGRWPMSQEAIFDLFYAL